MYFQPSEAVPSGPATEVDCRVTATMENQIVVRVGTNKRVLACNDFMQTEIGSPPCNKKLCVRDDIVIGVIKD